jgi:hypothetical protein
MAHLHPTGIVLPPSAFVAPVSAPGGRQSLPPVGALPPVGSVQPPPEIPAAAGASGARNGGFAGQVSRPAESTTRIWAWLIAILPLLQFAVIYVVFGILAVAFAPGMQWGILAAPAALSLLFANYDKKKLTEFSVGSPSIVFAFIPPLYLIARCLTAGRSSLIPLIAWIVLQLGAAAGAYFLLHHVLTEAIQAIG